MRRLFVLSAAAAALIVGTSFAATPKPPKTVTASPITRPAGTLKPGTTVSSSGLGTRTFVNAKDGFALASESEAQYAAATTDGGTSWHTISPALHVNAAQAPLSVLFVGAASVKTVYAYGGGEFVDTTADGGKTWWRARLGDSVNAVEPGPGKELDAFAQTALGTSSRKVANWTYTSSDGGHHWHYTSGFVGG